MLERIEFERGHESRTLQKLIGEVLIVHSVNPDHSSLSMGIVYELFAEEFSLKPKVGIAYNKNTGYFGPFISGIGFVKYSEVEELYRHK